MAIPLSPALVLFLAATPAQEGHELLKQAMAQHREKDFAKAKTSCEAAIAAFGAKGDRPGQGTAFMWLGNTLMALGDKRAARDAYAKAHDLFVGTASSERCTDMDRYVAILSVMLEEWEVAIPRFEAVAKSARFRKDARLERYAMLWMAVCVLDMEEVRQGRPPTRTRVDLDPEPREHRVEAELLMLLGRHHRNKGQDRNALDAFRLAAESYQSAGDVGASGRALSSMGDVLNRLGEKAKAMEAYEKALPLLHKAGDRSRIVGTTQALLARCAEIGDTERARKLAKEGLEEARKAKDARAEAYYLGSLGILEDMMGRTAEGLLLGEEALRQFRSIGDSSHEAWLLKNLGAMHGRLQAPEKERLYYEKALEIHRRNKDLLGEAGMLQRIGQDLIGSNPPEAEARLMEALSLYRKLSNQFGEVNVLCSLGAHFQERDENAKALTYYEHALLLTGTLGSRRVEADTRESLGRLHTRLGNFQKAEEMMRRAIELCRANRNLDGLGDTLLMEAMILARLGRFQECPPLFKEGAQVQSQIREAAFPAMSERQKLGYLGRFESLQHAYLSLVATRFPSDPSIVRPCFEAWIGFKGNILEAQGRIHGAVLASRDPKIQELRAALQEARQWRARLFQAQTGEPETEKRIREAQERVDALEVALGQKSQAFAMDREASRLDIAALARLLPAGAAYLDFARIWIRDFEHWKWGDEHYVAFLFRPEGGGQVRLLDLGPTQAVDGPLADLRKEIQAGMPVSASLERLHRLLVQPLEPFLGDVRQLRICPDGPLHLLPFELLAPKGSRPLMDRFEVSYLSSAMDLPRFRIPATSNRQVAILADPDFDLSQSGGAPRGTSRGSRDIQGIHFAPLPETRKEAETIRGLFPPAEVLCMMGREATEGRLQALQAPRILHLATHGYFLGQQSLGGPGADRGLKVVGSDPQPDPRLENPMLRSGLALSGANLSIRQGEDEGLVCAEKVLGMNLFGTDLVVLSACNTGVGRIADGQGVFGIKRAFALAGARTLVVSLWPVPDEETRELMEAFYRNLARGLPKVQALQQARRSVAERKPHPVNWAAFVLLGSPE